jgi:hypothetical protein
MRSIKVNVLLILIAIIHYCAYGQILVENKELRLTQIIDEAVFTDTSYVYSNITILVDDLDADKIDLGLASPLDRRRFEVYKNGAYSDLDRKGKDKM